MRAMVSTSVALLLSTASAAVAQVASTAEPTPTRIHAMQIDYQLDEWRSPDGDEQAYRVKADPFRDAQFDRGGFSLGAIRMDIDSTATASADPTRDGRVSHFAHVHLENVRLLGGDVSGTFDGRSATLRLSWPTGE